MAPETHPDGTYREGAVYARVLRRTSSKDPHFAGATYQGKQVKALIQYWLYYRYDDWRAPTVAGVIEQKHEGDWEGVMVALSNAAPLFVAYTAHCGGNWYPWHRIDAVSLPQAEPPNLDHYRTHPLVAVAEGSHANYVGAAVNRTPDWGSCEGLTTSNADILSFAANIRDRTGDAWRQIPRAIEPTVLRNKLRPPMTYIGHWGGEDETDLLGVGMPRTIVRGNGPTTPSAKRGLWNVPIWTILCGERTNHWHPPRKDPPQVVCKSPPRTSTA